MLLAVPAQAIDLQARLFRGFADASRLAILEALRAKPLSVSDIVRATGLNQPNVSNHLACLRDCGLVASEQAGRFVRYRLSDERVARLLSLADALLTDVARGVYQCTHLHQPAEQPQG
jgi:DNA-binding transcriptional ArsR family regulator